jgi:hypothetical protein
MSAPVIVTISAATIARLEHDIHIGYYLVKQLSEAGAPVVGTVWPRFASGTLVCTTDPATGGQTWMWQP